MFLRERSILVFICKSVHTVHRDMITFVSNWNLETAAKRQVVPSFFTQLLTVMFDATELLVLVTRLIYSHTEIHWPV